MDLFEILSDDERIILCSDEEAGMIVTWNFSLTLQCYCLISSSEWEEIDIRTFSKEPDSLETARHRAKGWLNEILGLSTPDPFPLIVEKKG